ncbi:MAG: imidazolonepropionase [Bacteroidetes bacterium]|nr:imidazolonepropionase [Bacteroidota bacterium]
MKLIIRNIAQLVHTEISPKLKFSGSEMSDLQTISKAFLCIEDDRIHSYGEDNDSAVKAILSSEPNTQIIDAKGGMVFPSWCDSHTHIVYAGSRELEFVDRINGLTYEQIFSRGGGILNSSAKLRLASEDELFESASLRLEEIIRMGTGAVEIKSGYGLSTESELKMLRVIRRLKEKSPLTIKATFLGAHAIPPEFKNNKDGYLKLIMTEMIPAIASEKLAEYCDIFCEKDYFTSDDVKRLFEVANKHGLTPKVHAEQLSHSGGIKAGVESGAISVDHLEFIEESDMKALKGSKTMPVLLPGAQFFLGLKVPPAREMIKYGLPVAISTDYNPGSCPSGNMNQMISLACILYKMTPEEAIIAATTNSAYAMDLSKDYGSISKGKKANLFITKPIPSYAFLPYSFGSRLTDTVILNGKVICTNLN